jgi:DNA-binding response OmpR family regulator
MASESILIIDDDRNLRQSMALILRRAGFKVDMAGTAGEALADLKYGHYDLAILDMMMPDDGTILLPRLHRLYPRLPILILSSQLTPETPFASLHSGKYERLVKPVTPEALLEKVKAILSATPLSEVNHSVSINGE